MDHSRRISGQGMERPQNRAGQPDMDQSRRISGQGMERPQNRAGQPDMDQSRRISGQGMERPQFKTPRTRKDNQYRAVSTPQVEINFSSLCTFCSLKHTELDL